ncbi:hypothetical protein ACQJBY_029552 [Aegilops geniculata]
MIKIINAKPSRFFVPWSLTLFLRSGDAALLFLQFQVLTLLKIILNNSSPRPLARTRKAPTSRRTWRLLRLLVLWARKGSSILLLV